jgi:cytochrome c-type biogenesis protein CcmH
MEPLLPRVDIAVSTSSAPPAGATLFVIARPPGGGMPFAVVRRPASELPLDIVLDDTVSMNPALPLSAAPAFEVVARISLSGTPAPHPGDCEWRSEVFAPETMTAPAALAAELAPPATADLR